VLDLVIGNRYARQVRDAADGIGVYGHAKSPTFNRNTRPSLYQRRSNEPTAGTGVRPTSTDSLDRIALASHPI
jgi:hypothetical protein